MLMGAKFEIKLDKQQRKAVESKSPRILVNAGPGTGKTKVIVSRIRNLIEERNVDPTEILALSFSNKTVERIEDEIEREVDSKHDIPVKTFHSFALAIIRENELLHGIANPKIMGEVSQYKILNEALNKHDFKSPALQKAPSKSKYIKDLLKFISEEKNKGSTPESLEKTINGRRTELLKLKGKLRGIRKEVEDRLNSFKPSDSEYTRLRNKTDRDLLIQQLEAIFDTDLMQTYALDNLKTKLSNNKLQPAEIFKVTSEHLNEAWAKLKEGNILLGDGAKEQAKRLREQLEKLKGQYLDKEAAIIRIASSVLEKTEAYDVNTFKKEIKSLKNYLKKNNEEALTAKDLIDVFNELEAKKIRNIEAELKKLDNTSDVAKLFREYEKTKQDRNQIDFDDMILIALKAISTHPEIQDQIQTSYKHLIVDDLQSLSHLQLELINAIKPENIFAAVDPNQEFWSFKGAVKNIFEEFKKLFKPQVIELKKNYRNTREILSVAGDVVPELKNYTPTKKGSKVRLFQTKFIPEEAQNVANQIKEAISKGMSPNEIVILVSKKKHALPIAFALRDNNIPFEDVEGSSLLHSSEIKNILAYLDIIKNSASRQSDNSVLRIVKEKTKAITPEAIAEFSLFARNGTTINDNGIERKIIFPNYLKALQNIRHCKTIEDKYKLELEKIAKLLVELSDLSLQMNASDFINIIYQKTNYLKTLVQNVENESAPEEERVKYMQKLNNLIQFRQFARNFQQNEPDASLEDLVDHIKFAKEIGSLHENSIPTAGVKISTIHQFAGQEAKAAFVVNLTKENFPSKYFKPSIYIPREDSLIGTDKEDHLREQMRLLAAAMTRASDELNLTSSLFNYEGKSKREKPITPFINLSNKYLDVQKLGTVLLNFHKFSVDPLKREELMEKTMGTNAFFEGNTKNVVESVLKITGLRKLIEDRDSKLSNEEKAKNTLEETIALSEKIQEYITGVMKEVKHKVLRGDWNKFTEASEKLSLKVEEASKHAESLELGSIKQSTLSIISTCKNVLSYLDRISMARKQEFYDLVKEKIEVTEENLLQGKFIMPPFSLSELYEFKTILKSITESARWDNLSNIYKIALKHQLLIKFPLNMSATSLKMLETCERQYKFRYGFRMPGEDNKYLVLGRSVHTVAENLLKTPNPNSITLTHILGNLEMNWDPLAFTDFNESQSFKNVAQACIENLLEFQKKHPNRMHTAIEAEFKVPLSTLGLSREFDGKEIEAFLIGKYDRIDRFYTKENDDVKKEIWQIIDYKTNAQVETAEQIKQDLQTIIYYLAFKHEHGFYPDSFAKLFLRHGVLVEVSLTENELEAGIERIAHDYDRLLTQEFKPTDDPDICKRCVYEPICDYSKNTL